MASCHCLGVRSSLDEEAITLDERFLIKIDWLTSDILSLFAIDETLDSSTIGFVQTLLVLGGVTVETVDDTAVVCWSGQLCYNNNKCLGSHDTLNLEGSYCI